VLAEESCSAFASYTSVVLVGLWVEGIHFVMSMKDYHQVGSKSVRAHYLDTEVIITEWLASGPSSLATIGQMLSFELD